jgi:hypothetical protein
MIGLVDPIHVLTTTSTQGFASGKRNPRAAIGGPVRVDAM